MSAFAPDNVFNNAGFHLHTGEGYPASTQKGRLGSSKRADAPPGAMHAASVVKQQKRAGVTWADSPSPMLDSAAVRSPPAVIILSFHDA